MAFVLVNEGETKCLNLILGKQSTENLSLKLYTSNTTPAETDTAATYTEASGSGYAAKTLVAADWTVTGDTATATQQTFAFSGTPNIDVYGYYLVGATSGVLYIAERFAAAPYQIRNNGDEIRITPTMTAS